MIEKSIKSDLLLRLKKAEGQIRGIQKMIEKNRSHIEIIDQMYATRKAINMVGIIFMKNHLAATVPDVMRSAKKKKEIDDFMKSVHRFIN